MIEDQELSDSLRHEFRALTEGLTTDSATIEGVIRTGRAHRRRAGRAGAGGLLAVVVAALATVLATSSGSTRTPTLGSARLHLASYSFRLPVGSHAAGADTTQCASAMLGGVVYTPGPGEGATTPSQPTISQAVTGDGGCVSMLLTDPYVPGAANAPSEAFPIVDQHQVQIGSDTGTVGTAQFIGSGASKDGVTVPSGTTSQFLELQIPAAGNQVQMLLVSTAGISEQQLVDIVSSGLQQPVDATTTS